MERWRRFRMVGERMLAALGMGVIGGMPRAWVVRFARGMGWLGYQFGVGARSLAMANVDAAYGESLSREQKDAIVRESFRTFAQVLLDYFWFSRDTTGRVRATVRIDESFNAYFETAPLISLTAHFGNWEAMGMAAGLRGAGAVSVAIPLKNRVLDERLRRFREETGARIVAREGAVRALVKALKEGGRVALLTDQNVAPWEGGVFVDFFGMRATMSPVAARLAARLAVPVVIAFCRLEEDGGYRVAALPRMEPEAFAGGDEDGTQRIAAAMEEMIRVYPGQWMWMYKRWRYMDPGRPGGRYPGYARARGEAR